MKKKEHIVTYTGEEIDAMIARGEDRTDWTKVRARTQEEADRLADEDDGPLPEGWEKTIIIGLPPLSVGKEAIKLRLDRDVLNWFRHTGKGYQTRINNVLRSFVSSRMMMEDSGRR
jgi:uncharacterized protein (DUF4415 family)